MQPSQRSSNAPPAAGQLSSISGFPKTPPATPARIVPPAKPVSSSQTMLAASNKPVACTRCKAKKIKCDGKMPSCSSCVKAREKCLVADMVTGRAYPRGYIERMQNRISELQSLIDAKAREAGVLPARTASVSSYDDGSPTPSCLFSSTRLSSAASIRAHNSTPSLFSPRVMNDRGDLAFARLLVRTLLLNDRGPPTSKLCHIISNEGTSTQASTQAAELPQHGVSEALIELYLQNEHCCFPFLPAQGIYELVGRLYEGRPSARDCFRAFMVFAIGALSDATGSEDPSVTAFAHYNSALLHVGGLSMMAGIAAVQDILLLCVFSLNVKISQDAWVLSRRALQICIQEELHLSVPGADEGNDAQQMSLKRGVFWSAYCLNRITSNLMYDRPPSIPEAEIDVEVGGGPMAPFSFLERWGLTSDQAPTEASDGSFSPSTPSLLPNLVRLYRLSTAAFTSFNTNPPSGDPVSKLQRYIGEFTRYDRSAFAGPGQGRGELPVYVALSRGAHPMLVCQWAVISLVVAEGGVPADVRDLALRCYVDALESVSRMRSGGPGCKSSRLAFMFTLRALFAVVSLLLVRVLPAVGVEVARIGDRVFERAFDKSVTDAIGYLVAVGGRDVYLPAMVLAMRYALVGRERRESDGSACLAAAAELAGRYPRLFELFQEMGLESLPVDLELDLEPTTTMAAGAEQEFGKFGGLEGELEELSMLLAATSQQLGMATDTAPEEYQARGAQDGRGLLGLRDERPNAFVLVVSLTSLGVLAIVTWFNNQSLVTELRRSRLSLIGSLKSLTPSSDTRRNLTYANWNTSLIDTSLVLSTQSALQHVTVYSADFATVYLNVTSDSALPPTTPGFIEIQDATGNHVGFNSQFGHTGFPDTLFPTEKPNGGRILLGPVRSLNNATTYLASVTVPIYNNTTAAVLDKSILGYVTVVCTVDNIEATLSDYPTLGETYKYLLLGPVQGNEVEKDSGWPGNVSWRYVLPPIISTEGEGRVGGFLSQIATAPDYRGSVIDTRNPANGARVAIGFAPVAYDLASWMLVVQMDYSEVSQPITHLRNLLLATVFGTGAGVVVVTCILATYAVRPIARLRDATEKTTRPPGYSPTAYDSETEEPPAIFDAGGDEAVGESLRRRRPWWRRRLTADKLEGRSSRARKGRNFRVPDKVPDKKHLVTDELTDLTTTFNAMTDELVKQYTHLEERVATRTAELKEQTQLANAANEAKSMFIANVTHELRTPLNGILGMCSVILTDPTLSPGIKRSLNTIYKSGDLLLFLLTDLLTFSRNQVAGVNVTLEEGEFYVRELVTQVKAIFVKTARDKGVELGIEITPDSGSTEVGEPSIQGVLRGDLNRILQVVINLLSNALKFTPEKGSVQLRIAMLENTRGVALTIHDTPQKDMPTLKIPQTAMINPNTTANLALKAKKQATSLTIPSLTTPGELSNSSAGEAYFDKGKEGEEEESGPEESKAPTEDPLITTRWFEFSVIDTGPGIPSHMHTKIFEPFVQGDLGLSRRYGGTGLGLSICKQLAELMGGVIELKSFEGAGSTFTLRIPLRAGGFATQIGTGYSRPGSLATTRYTRNLPPNLRPRGEVDNVSTKSASTAFSSISGNQAEATRLVGFSQPFFAPEVVEDEGFRERRQNRAGERRQSRVDHSPPPLPGIPSYSEAHDGDRGDEVGGQRRPTLERTSSSPAMLTPRNPEGYFAGSARKATDDRGKLTPPLTVGSNGSAPPEPAVTQTSSAEPAKAEQRAPPPPAVTVSPSKSVRISKSAANPETAGESSSAPKKDKISTKDLKNKRASIKVLVAEDNRVNIQVIKKMLRLEAVTDVTMAEDGAVAVQKVREALSTGKKFDIILMDIQMPNMDGLQATKEIREMGYTSAICALTAFAEQSNVKECFDAGMDYFLAKPIKKHELRKVLQLYGSSSQLTDLGGGSGSA
ncbi:hypothetical protein DRE_07370 [Drechslerella stenobrocha 248]|uniref:histidine kinase n=1 Tax=Drechslerella stenobrocha 248 TaxID=1043628 RepID=W7HUP5_9PEZI|nr:hypothetical protein DRE_07370 [Drechslerella stenobrocha 248]